MPDKDLSADDDFFRRDAFQEEDSLGEDFFLFAKDDDNLLKRNPVVPFPVGLERDGEVLLKPFCPPYYPSMAEAVRAAVDLKFGVQGIFRGGSQGSAWAKHGEVTAQVPPISDAAIAATTDYCEYVWNRYGRFPVYMPPYRTVLGFQACHLDAEFYDKFYRPEALGESQRQDCKRGGPPRAWSVGSVGASGVEHSDAIEPAARSKTIL
jgi:hypothetical protein